jgi:excinuclease UvrABC helicase subunit UvrB
VIHSSNAKKHKQVKKNKFKIVSKYKPAGDQPSAIKALVSGLGNKMAD